MEFFHHITSDIKGVRGFMTVYQDALRYLYMITEKALKKRKKPIKTKGEEYGIWKYYPKASVSAGNTQISVKKNFFQFSINSAKQKISYVLNHKQSDA